MAPNRPRPGLPRASESIASTTGTPNQPNPTPDCAQSATIVKPASAGTPNAAKCTPAKTQSATSVNRPSSDVQLGVVLGHFYADAAPKLTRTARRRVGRDDGEDAVQEACLRMLQHSTRPTATSSDVRKWLFGFLRRIIKEMISKELRARSGGPPGKEVLVSPNEPVRAVARTGLLEFRYELNPDPSSPRLAVSANHAATLTLTQTETGFEMAFALNCGVATQILLSNANPQLPICIFVQSPFGELKRIVRLTRRERVTTTACAVSTRAPDVVDYVLPLRVDLVRAIANLPESERVAFLMSTQGMNSSEIAEWLGVNKTTAWRRTKRAIATLAERLAVDLATQPSAP